MTKGFQKPANSLHELHISHPGIIDATDFDRHFELHCYAPSPDLQPFVTHIWTQRPRQPSGSHDKPPVEIISGPNVYLFFTPQASFIHGVTRQGFAYDPRMAPVIAGVKFRPGGFYPFVQQSLSRLAMVTPIASVFPAVDDIFTQKMLARPDTHIVQAIESLLRDRNPLPAKNSALAARIVDAITNDNSLRTVSAVAQSFAMSERSLQLLFQTYVGVGVKWVITRKRLLEAIHRAQKQPHLSWVEVAAELGYSSQSHFSRDFKNVTGLAPSQYRQ